MAGLGFAGLILFYLTFVIVLPFSFIALIATIGLWTYLVFALAIVAAAVIVEHFVPPHRR